MVKLLSQRQHPTQPVRSRNPIYVDVYPLPILDQQLPWSWEISTPEWSQSDRSFVTKHTAYADVEDYIRNLNIDYKYYEPPTFHVHRSLQKYYEALSKRASYKRENLNPMMPQPLNEIKTSLALQLTRHT